jgi:hypothetical protein
VEHDDARTIGRRLRQIRNSRGKLTIYTRRDAVGRELRGMAYRAGLLV